ncbi:protein aveugle-like [Diadema setosum]|uniref:protein aveugle-like n=1 Tax=Diadema setosum TaxID=31175 RepID=UPI003B3B94DA
MSNPKYYGSRTEINSKGRLGLSNGSLDSRVLRERSQQGQPHSHAHHHGSRQQLQKPSRSKKSVYLWTTGDVLSWLQKKHREYLDLYGGLFEEHDISGKALVRLNEMKLERMGIQNKEHRTDIHVHIVRLRIKHEQTELKLLKKGDRGIVVQRP